MAVYTKLTEKDLNNFFLKYNPAPYRPTIINAITKKNITIVIVIFFDLFIYFLPHSVKDPS